MPIRLLSSLSSYPLPCSQTPSFRSGHGRKPKLRHGAPHICGLLDWSSLHAKTFLPDIKNLRNKVIEICLKMSVSPAPSYQIIFPACPNSLHSFPLAFLDFLEVIPIFCILTASSNTLATQAGAKLFCSVKLLYIWSNITNFSGVTPDFHW